MKRSALIVSIALTQALMADAMSDKASQNNSMMQDSGMMNTSARPNIQSNNWYLFGDAICWQAQSEKSNWATASSPGGTASNGYSLTNVYQKQVSFDWNWGFRVGVGYNMEHDEWDTKLYYTWFQTKQFNAVSVSQNAASGPGSGYDGANGNFVLDPEATTLVDAKGVKNVWNIHYSVFDWDMGRAYHISKNLCMRPNVGVKGGWINQNLKQTVNDFAGNPITQPSSYNTYQKNNFWFVGPSGGIDTKWMLGAVDTHNFSLFGDFQGALMYGRIVVSATQNGPYLGQLRSPVQSIARVSPMLRAVMGFGWDTNFNNDCCHFAMKLGYEVQYWFGQNQFFATGGWNGGVGNLAFQGGTLDLRFDF